MRGWAAAQNTLCTAFKEQREGVCEGISLNDDGGGGDVRGSGSVCSLKVSASVSGCGLSSFQLLLKSSTLPE
ncbi:hypothetical protein EYF80_038895 [Liparis tanakae]|uniref:Uncharacterized protein n=1 Tax=Liparis tanakae TaxID=230148 RepID=A0A4Z2GDW6_9TELE|nr:hypothetical protein EYF80_038895 [Liparis tanakae]